MSFLINHVTNRDLDYCLNIDYFSMIASLTKQQVQPHKTNVIHTHLRGLQLHSIATSYSWYSIKSKQTRYTKVSYLRKEVGITVKSKGTSSQLKPVRNNYVAIMHQPVITSSNIQPNTCTSKAFSSISTRFNPYRGQYKINK